MRELKAHLSEYIRAAAGGKPVTVRVYNRPVARIVPLKLAERVRDLADTPGIRWNGRKPKGLIRPETMRKGVVLSDWVREGRR